MPQELQVKFHVNPSDVVALIPARGGSVGVPRKNIRPLAGKPLIAWTIAAAEKASTVGRVLVSTDDEEIAGIARSLGADVPFMRPPTLAQVETPDLPVCIHVLEELQRRESVRPKYVVWLRPTAPLRTADDIDQALSILAATGAESVRSVSMTKAHPYWMKTLENGRLRPFVEGCDEHTHTRRQMLPPVYMLNGAVDAVRADIVREDYPLWGKDVAAYVMPAERSIDIDTSADFAVAEALLARETT